MTTDNLHAERMKSLIEFTAQSFATDYPSPFGAAIYHTGSGELIAQSYDSVMRHCDPTNHGEINVIRLATQKLRQLSLRGYTLYSTCEPCPMCMSACIWAEIDTLVYGASTMEDANAYWPQPSDMTPEALVSHMLEAPRCLLVPHVERDACRKLFAACDQARRSRGLAMPPHRLQHY